MRLDSANPYRWADLAEVYAADGNIPQARYAFDRALALGPAVPQISVRVANFHFAQDEPDALLSDAARVLKTVPNFDQVLFSYLDSAVHDPSRVLSEIGDDRRAARAYTEHFFKTNDIPGARASWRFLLDRHFADDRLTTSYIDAFLRNHAYAEARQDWASYTGNHLGLIFNGGFEREFTGCILDWRIQPSDQFETARDNSVAHSGHWSLRIQFHGNDNVSYGHVAQTATALPGNYVLKGWIRTDQITTDEGLRLEAFDPENPSRLDIRTESVVGTTDWKPLTLTFHAGEATHLLAVRVMRDASRKFDNKIAGTAWLDDISLEPR